MHRKTIAFALAIGLSSAAHAAAPQEVLSRARAAAGGSAWDGVRAFHIQARVSTGGLSGTAEGWEDVIRGLYLNTFNLGPVQGAEGYDGTSPWSRDPSGQITVSDSGDAREGSVNESYRVARSWWYPERRKAAVEDGGERTEEGRTFQVVRIHPEGGRPFEAWFDAATGLLDRTVERTSNETRTNFLSDYRDVGGLKLPFRQRSTNGEPKYDSVVEVESVEVNPGLDAARFSPPRVRLDDVALAGGAASAVIPFELINNHIFVNVFVDGHGPVRMIFDTGGSNLITPEVAARLGLKTEGRFQARGVGEKTEDIGLTRVRELRLGDVTLRDQSLFVLALADMDKVEGVDVGGIVGFELFKRLVVRIDYAGRRLTLTRPDAFTPPAAASPIAFTFDERTPQVEGRIDGLPGRFTIDTGSRTSLDLNGPFTRTHGLQERYGAKIQAVTGWGLGGPARSAVAKAGLLELGGVRVESPVVHLSLQEKGALSNPYLAGNVGGAILKRFTATFDYDHQVMYLEPNGQPAEAYDRAGLWINRDGDGYAVMDVVADGPAAEAGLKPGDRIVALDGRLAKDLPVSEARGRLREAPGTRVRLTVGTGREVTLVLRDLI